MAHSLSAKKRIRQNEKRRMRNRGHRSALRTVIKQCREELQHGTVASAESSYQRVCRTLDREASRGIIHRNTAARRKSRLAKRLNELRAKAAQ